MSDLNQPFPLPQAGEEPSLGQILVNVASFLRRSALALVLGILIGLGGGAVWYYLTPKEWDSEMICYSNNLTHYRLAEVVNDLGLYVKKKDGQGLADALKITPAQASKVGYIKGLNNLELDGERWETGRGIEKPCKVKVTVKDTTLLPVLQKAIEEYVERNPYVARRQDIYKATNDTLMRRQMGEIQYLQSFKPKLEEALAKGGVSQVNGSVSQDIERLYQNYIIEMRDKIYTQSDFHVVKPFTYVRKQTWPKLTVMLGIGAAIGFAGSLLSFLFVQARTKKA